MKLSISGSTEGIIGQDTQFFNALTHVFQQAIAYRDGIVGSEMLKIKNVIEYCEKEMSVNLKKCIQDYTNLIVEKVHLSKVPNVGMWTLMYMKDPHTTVAIKNRYSGLAIPGFGSDVTEDTQDILEKIAKAVDTVNNKITIDPSKYMRVRIDIGFDPYSFLLIKECVHTKLERATAKELAAGMLHEIGHSYSALEHCADTYFRITTFQNMTREFLKTASKPLRNKLYIEIAEKLPKDHKDVAAIIKECVGEENKASAADDSKVIILTKTLGTAGRIALGILAGALSLAYTIGGVGFTHESPGLTTMYADMLKTTKVSDFKFTIRNVAWEERMADEYAAKHGAGKDFVKMHDKLWAYSTFVDRMDNAKRSPNAIRSSTIMYYLYQLPVIVTDLLIGDCSSGLGMYEWTMKERVERVGRMTLDALKNTELSPEMVDHYIKTYEEISVDVAAAAKSTAYVHSKIRAFISYWISPVALLQTIKDGKFDKEYLQLMDDIEKMSANTLFYHAAKLDQLTRK